MSSESEDEFQSADEGSDLEDFDSDPKASLHTQSLYVPAAFCERVHETEKDETQSEAELSKDTSYTAEAVGTDMNKKGIIEKTETLRRSEKSSPVDVDEDGNVPFPVSCIKVDESVEETHELTTKASKVSINQESCEKSYSYVGKLPEDQIYENKEVKDDELHSTEPISDEQNVAAQIKVIEESEEKSVHTQCKTEVLPSETVTPGNSKTENTTDEVKGLVPNMKSRPIRQSKIGMKKPREKLGERIGARKLGAKVTSRSTDSISSSDAMKLKGEDVSTGEKECQIAARNVMENRGEEDEKMKKRQQWEEQQERWHQALNLERDMKEAFSGDGDGWSAPWGGWGDTLLSAASSFTREVGRGVGTVIETVESSIGVPSPDVMAQEVCDAGHKAAGKDKPTEIEKQVGNEESNAGSGRSTQQVEASYGLGGFSLGSLVTGVSGALETASSKVLMGGLDTLEVIGRKAMDVIQEGDPGLHKKRAFLSNKKPNLSQILQEARQKAMEDERDGLAGGGNKNSQKPSFEKAWEATEGPVHLEALSLVGKQCQNKMASIMATLPHYVQEKLVRENTIIKTTCELDELEPQEEDLAEVVPDILVRMHLPLQPQKLIEAWSSVQERTALIQETGSKETHEIEDVLYGTLAQLVAQFCALAHKGGELALITSGTDPLDVVSHFKELGQAVSGGLECVADQVCGALTSEGTVADAQVSSTITNIYLQAASGNNYIQESLVLLASVLQYSNTKSAAAHH